MISEGMSLLTGTSWLMVGFFILASLVGSRVKNLMADKKRIENYP